MLLGDEHENNVSNNENKLPTTNIWMKEKILYTNINDH